MSTYGNYHGPINYDTNPPAHIPSISILETRQPYLDDSNSLPPMNMRALNGSTYPSSLLRDSPSAQEQFQAGPPPVSHDHGMPHYVSQHGGFFHSNGIARSQPQMHPSSSSHAAANPISPTYNGVSPVTTAAHNAAFVHSSLPPSTSAQYASHIEGDSLGGYGASIPQQMRSTQYPHEDFLLDNMGVRRSHHELDMDTARAGVPNEKGSASNAPFSAGKNAEGKFPCTLCNKTYQHQKHLKRHNLRHTGERPYRCHLCHETFCRSDILKRHFAKCSIRRGNPEGITHLTHAQDHLKKPSGESGPSALGVGGPHSASGPDSSVRGRTQWTKDNVAFPPTATATRHAVPGVHDGSNGSSRASSVIPPGSSGSGVEEKRSHVLAPQQPLPPIQTSEPSEPADFSYDQPMYPRAAYASQDQANEPTYYQQLPDPTSPYTMQQNSGYAISSHPQPFNNISGAEAAGNGHHWMPEAPFHTNGHETMMYSGS